MSVFASIRTLTFIAYVYKLEQDTWLCRTHLDDFLVKLWTILDHFRPYHIIFETVGPL